MYLLIGQDDKTLVSVK